MMGGSAGAAFLRAFRLKGEDMPATSQYCLYIGTYTWGKSEGIYRLRLDSVNGEMSVEGATGGVENPSFLAIHPGKKLLYAANETGSYLGKPGGAAAAFAIGPDNGLEFINRQATHGAAPCHVAVDRSGKWVFTANYTGGNITLFPIRADGALEAAADVLAHAGTGPDKVRQEGPHPHSIGVAPDNRFVVAADLGIDKLMVYRFDAQNGELTPNDPPHYAAAPGAGPRHMAFHPGGKYAFVINELDCRIQSLAFDARAGAFAAVDAVSALPSGFDGENTCADVRVSPDGRFVYGSNRGHDSIAGFSFDEATGRLGFMAHESALGKTPRSFALTADGAFLVAANQNSDNVVSYFRDRETGGLKPTGFSVAVPAPVCVAIL